MTDSPPAARLARPSWLDVRLVLGVLFVLLAVVIGARVLASADDSTRVWGLTRDLAPGAVLGTEDLQRVQVRLFEADERYVSATAGADAPTGYVLTRALGEGELLPRAALRDPRAPTPDLREVSVPVESGHLPANLSAGQLVDVYVTRASGVTHEPGRRTDAASPPRQSAGPTELVLRQVPVLARSGQDRGVNAQAVVLAVPAEQVAGLVEALRAGPVDLVRLTRGTGVDPLLRPDGP